jgi:hypothetical protein
MLVHKTMSQEQPAEGQTPKIGFCEEKNRLMDEFLQAARELIELHNQQMRAAIQGDLDFGRFDLLLHLAHEKKEQAKYAWMAHVHSHHCVGEGLL